MRPIEFGCEEIVMLSPRDICERITRVESWDDFAGYGPVPGIVRAEYERRTEGVVGSRIRVENTDGSTHIEEIVEWRPDERVVLRMSDFSPPLNRLAVHFVEAWYFSSAEGGTRVRRQFALHARSRGGWLVLRLVSVFLRRAVAEHLRHMREDAASTANAATAGA